MTTVITHTGELRSDEPVKLGTRTFVFFGILYRPEPPAKYDIFHPGPFGPSVVDQIEAFMRAEMRREAMQLANQIDLAMLSPRPSSTRRDFERLMYGNWDNYVICHPERDSV